MKNFPDHVSIPQAYENKEYAVFGNFEKIYRVAKKHQLFFKKENRNNRLNSQEYLILKDYLNSIFKKENRKNRSGCQERPDSQEIPVNLTSRFF